MLASLRSDSWKRRAFWSRAVGLALLLLAFFFPLPPTALVAVTVAGLLLFFLGALAWLVRDTEPWRRT